MNKLLKKLHSLFQQLRESFSNTKSTRESEAAINRVIMMSFSVASIFASMCSILASFAILRWVPPEDMGIWQLALLVPFYANFLNLGLIFGLARELPFSLGQDKEDFAQELVDTALMLITNVSVLILIGGLLWSFYWPSLSYKWRLCIGANFAFAALQQMMVYLSTLYRSKNAFRTFTFIMFGYGFLQLGSITLVYHYHLWGVILRVILVLIIFIAILFIWRPIRPKYRFKKLAFTTMLKTGIPLLLFSSVRDILLTTDRILLATVADEKVLGYYTIANFVYLGMSFIPMSLGMYIYPKMAYRYGLTKTRKSLWQLTWKSLILMLVLSLPLTFAGIGILHFIVPQWAPEYIPGLSIAILAALGGWIYSGTVVINVLHTLKVWWGLAVVLALGAIGLFGTWYALPTVAPLWRAAYAGAAMRAIYLFSSLFIIIFVILYQKDPETDKNT